MAKKPIFNLQYGSVIQVAKGAGGTIYRPPGGTHTFVYVERVEKRGDFPEYFESYEIVPIDTHSKSYLDNNTRFMKLDADAVSIAGLAQGKEWAIILEPRRIYPTPENLGKKSNNSVEVRGNIAQTPFIDRFQQIVHNSGGTAGLRARGGDPTGYVSSSDSSNWGLFAPVGIRRGEWREYDAGYSSTRLKKAGRKEDKKLGTFGAEEGKVIDLPLEFAHAALGLDENLLNAVMKPHKKGLKALKTLRQLKDIEDLTPYLEGREEFIYDGTLLQARKAGLLRHDYVREMLSETFDDVGTKPITRFKKALLTGLNDPDVILEDFVEIDGDEEEQIAVIEELEEAQEIYIERLAKEHGKSIKTAWSQFAGDYLTLKQGQEIESPERYVNQGEDKPIQLVKAVGRRQASFIVVEEGKSAAIMLPNSLYPKMG